MNNKTPAIEVREVYKEFVLPQTRNSSIKNAFVNIVRRNKKSVQKVLDGVSLTVNKGDFFGIVGRNGSGKSTLLKIIAGVYSPTKGGVKLHGKLTPFIELGVGFNPELTGRDNVYLNGALLGFTRKQMEAMYDDIVEFAELGPFMDQKLKNYSSGMQVRLAFSVAIKAQNDIMIFDEVLAVGDANFQEKCIRQFNKFKREGKTIILVTHSMDMVSKFCNRALLISAGKIVYDGGPEEAIDKYESLNMGEADVSSRTTKTSNQKVRVKSIDIVKSGGEIGNILHPEEGFTIRLNIFSNIKIDRPFIAMRLCESENQFVVAGFDTEDKSTKVNLKEGENIVDVKVKKLPLTKGKYYIVAGIYDTEKRKQNYAHYNGLQHGRLFLIKAPTGSKPGIVEINTTWIN